VLCFQGGRNQPRNCQESELFLDDECAVDSVIVRLGQWDLAFVGPEVADMCTSEDTYSYVCGIKSDTSGGRV
jgi:hypothetical protein